MFGEEIDIAYDLTELSPAARTTRLVRGLDLLYADALEITEQVAALAIPGVSLYPRIRADYVAYIWSVYSPETRDASRYAPGSADWQSVCSTFTPADQALAEEVDYRLLWLNLHLKTHWQAYLTICRDIVQLPTYLTPKTFLDARGDQQH